MLPAATIFIHHSRSSNVFLVVIFAVSAWNGANFYVEVFGRKCVFSHGDKEPHSMAGVKRISKADGSNTGSKRNWRSCAKRWKRSPPLAR